MNPFVFDAAPRSRERLLNSLERIGLELVDEHQGYRECVWILEYRWLTEKCVLTWLQEWWPDGVHREDVGVRLAYGTETLAEVGFGDLSAETGGVSLRGGVTQKVTQVFSEITGKHA